MHRQFCNDVYQLRPVIISEGDKGEAEAGGREIFKVWSESFCII